MQLIHLAALAGVLAPLVLASPVPPTNHSSPDVTHQPVPYNYLAGGIQNPEPAPHTPAGGADTSPSDVPYYHPISDFDWESLNLALHQEYIELDLFRYALKRFSVAEFAAAGLGDNDRYLLEFMSDQEVGHARLISNILGPRAAKECTYKYPFDTVKGFLDFSQKLTKWGEAGVYGFLPHLDSRASASLLLQSITTEARQQMIFRQMEGLHPMPVWFEPAIPQSWAWTLLAPYIESCPKSNDKLAWANFPALTIKERNPITTSKPGISPITPPQSHPGRKLHLSWDEPGRKVGPNKNYTTSSLAGSPKYVIWISQLNHTYTELTDIDGRSGVTVQPGGIVYPPQGGLVDGKPFAPVADPAVNGTMFIAIVDDNPYITGYNLSNINKHVVAGPAMYTAG